MGTGTVTRREAIGGMAAGMAIAGALLLLGGCGSRDSSDARMAISQGIDADMAKLSSLDEAQASALFPGDFTQQLIDAGVDPSSVYAPLFSALSYEVTGIDVASDGTEATAHITVLNKDIQAALENYSDMLTDYLAQQQDASMDRDDYLAHMADLLTQALSSDDLTTISTSVDVTYDLVDGAWVARDTSELRRAILGGMTADGLSSALNE